MRYIHFVKLTLKNAKIDCRVAAWGTGKSFSETLILASTNPQYDKNLAHEDCKLKTWGEHFVYTNCSECQKTTTKKCVHNIFSPGHVLSLQFSCIELIIQ